MFYWQVFRSFSIRSGQWVRKDVVSVPLVVIAILVLIAATVGLATAILPAAGATVLILGLFGGAIVVLITRPTIQNQWLQWGAVGVGTILLVVSYFGILPSRVDPGLRAWLLVIGAGLVLLAAGYAPARRAISRTAVWIAIIAAIVFLLGGRPAISERIQKLAEWRPTAAVAARKQEPKVVELVIPKEGKARFDLGAWISKNPGYRFWQAFYPEEKVKIILPDGRNAGHYQGSGTILFSGPAGERVRIVFYAEPTPNGP